ncbi:hypothetical protein B0H14DRAFT_2589842 [Mycena olivaceomarginata]|nr:hypothetical protein B0H14DRAFT_2589842 [Mycena olivaceomarginata]
MSPVTTKVHGVRCSNLTVHLVNHHAAITAYPFFLPTRWPFGVEFLTFKQEMVTDSNFECGAFGTGSINFIPLPPSMNNTVNEVDWVAQGKFWASVPPRVKRMAAEYFRVTPATDLELGLGLGDRIDVLRDLPTRSHSRIFWDQFVHHQSTCIQKKTGEKGTRKAFKQTCRAIKISDGTALCDNSISAAVTTMTVFCEGVMSMQTVLGTPHKFRRLPEKILEAKGKQGKSNFQNLVGIDCVGTGFGRSRKTSILSPSPNPNSKSVAGVTLTIPQELEFELLPSPYLSIAKMLDFPLPLQNNMITVTQPAQFFSINRPDITDKDLLIRARRLPIPDSKTVHKLVACSRQSWLDGNQSVVYSHLGGDVTHFPPWILSYWVVVVDHKRDVWIPWRKAQEWVKNNKKIITKNPTRAALAEDTAVMLAMLPWGLAKRGLSDSEPFHSLWRFLGTHWLSGSQMNDMLELLRYKINSDPELVKNTRVAGIELLPKILAAHPDDIKTSESLGLSRTEAEPELRSSLIGARGWLSKILNPVPRAFEDRGLPNAAAGASDPRRNLKASGREKPEHP